MAFFYYWLRPYPIDPSLFIDNNIEGKITEYWLVNEEGIFS